MWLVCPAHHPRMRGLQVWRRWKLEVWGYQNLSICFFGLPSLLPRYKNDKSLDIGSVTVRHGHQGRGLFSGIQAVVDYVARGPWTCLKACLLGAYPWLQRWYEDIASAGTNKLMVINQTSKQETKEPSRLQPRNPKINIPPTGSESIKNNPTSTQPPELIQWLCNHSLLRATPEGDGGYTQLLTAVGA